MLDVVAERDDLRARLSGPGLVEEVARVVRERDALRAELEELRAAQEILTRRLYRKGYHAGHAAASRGAPEVTAPERLAKGADGRLMRGELPFAV